MTSSTPLRIKPSRWFYVIGIIILVGGPIISSIFLFSVVFSNTSTINTGSSNITLSQTGKYTVFYEYQSMVGNRIYSTGKDIPSIQVNLVSKDTWVEILLSATFINSIYTLRSICYFKWHQAISTRKSYR
jgi:hypothetical protein